MKPDRTAVMIAADMPFPEMSHRQKNHLPVSYSFT